MKEIVPPPAGMKKPKNERILELLRKGHTPADIATLVGVRPAVVHMVKFQARRKGEQFPEPGTANFEPEIIRSVRELATAGWEIEQIATECEVSVDDVYAITGRTRRGGSLSTEEQEEI